MQRHDTEYLIIGGGIYGLYAARCLARKGVKVLLVEAESELFSRASYANQARVHFGYHYPRSLATARKTQMYFEKFCREFPESLRSDFNKIYAISDKFSLTSPSQFERFCGAAGIPCEPVQIEGYFERQHVAAAYQTQEYTYDARILRDLLLKDLDGLPVAFKKGVRVVAAQKNDSEYLVDLSDGTTIGTKSVLNATYASINQVNALFGLPGVPIKYELCEVILIEASPDLADLGLTVMDGPFFSIMPFGKTGLHALTSVAFTPHQTSYDDLPEFSCQRDNAECTLAQLDNCLTCPAGPPSSWPYMSQLARKYMNPRLSFSYKKSLFSVKPILRASELDDSRPTLIRRLSSAPSFIAVLSGKISTIFDLDEVLQ